MSAFPSITERINAYIQAGDALHTQMSAVLEIIIECNPPPALGLNVGYWYLQEFSASGDTVHLTTRRDGYGGDWDTHEYAVPAREISTGNVRAWADKAAKIQSLRTLEDKENDTRRELERLEARAKVLRGELSA